MRKKFSKAVFAVAFVCFLCFLLNIGASAATKVKIVSDLKSVTVESGKTAAVRVIAEGEGLTYKWYFKDASKTKFSLTKSFTTNEYSVAMTKARSGRQVYCVVSDKFGNTIKTQTVSLNMRAPLKIITQPKSVTVKKGAKATISLKAEGTGLKYEWYYKDAGEYIYSYTSSFKTATYSLTMTDARAGRSIYCVITDDLGNSVMSDVVSLNMKALKISEEPKSVMAAEGEIAAVKVNASGSGLKYKWYYKDIGSNSYLLDSGAKGNTYSIKMSKEISGRYLYCVVSDDFGNTAKTKEVYLVIESVLGPVITKQPENTVCAVGEKFEISVDVEGDYTHFKWQISEDGDTWEDLNSTTNKFTKTATTADFNKKYRCYIWDDYGNYCVTNTVTVRDETNLILKQPRNWVGCESGTAIFEIDVIESVISCQWQISRNNGETWSNSSVNGIFCTTTATQDKNNFLYRCIVEDNEGRQQISNVAKISISNEFYIVVQPTDKSAAFGEEVTFFVQAGGTNVEFEWQRSDDGVKWSAFGAKKARVSQTLQRYNAGKYYRCVITNGDGRRLVSGAVRLNWNSSGFFMEDGKKYYLKKDGTLAVGIEEIEGKIYCFSDANIMRTGFIKNGGKTYYFKEDGSAAKGFTYVPEINNLLYFTDSGAAATGWTEIDGKSYYFYDTGAMAWGVTQIGENEYFFNPNTGARTYGIVQVGLNNFMYFERNKANPLVGLKTIDGALYYFSESGSNRGITEGSRKTVDNKTYYFHPITKKAITGMVQYGSNIIYIGEDYTMVKSQLVKIGSNTYHFNSKGNMSYGLTTYNGNKYYFDTSTGAAVSGWVENDGAMLYFDPVTYKAKTGVVTINGVKYNFSSKGYLRTGVYKINGTRYYFSDPNNVKTGFVEVNNKVYYVDENQKLATGLTTIGKKLYYFDSTSVMRTGLRKVKGVKYYFDLETGAAVTGFVTGSNSNKYYYNGKSGVGKGLTKIKGSLYYLNENGIVRYGRIVVNNRIYCFDTSTGKALTGWQSVSVGDKKVYKSYFDPITYKAATGLKKIDGKLYYFDKNGRVKSGVYRVRGVTYCFSEGTYEAYKGWYKNKDGSQSYFNGDKGKLFGPDAFKIGGKYYYIDPKGRRLTGERIVKGKKMYFDPATGARVAKKPKKTSTKVKDTAPKQPKNAGKFVTVKGVKYYYGMNGKPVTGLQTIGGKLYYFDKNGKMKTGMIKVGGKYYNFGSSGAVSGTVKIKGKEYYFSPYSYQRLTGLQKVGSSYRYYDENGVRKSGWITTKDGKRIYVTSKGLTTGLAKIGSKTYYFGEDGIMRTGIQQVTNSSGDVGTYVFDKKGVMQKGLVTVGNNIYYHSVKTGTRVTGFLKTGGKEYYFDASSGVAIKGLRNIDGVYCYFDAKTAQRKYGLQNVGGKLYYFTESTENSGIFKGKKVVNKKTYFFSTETGIALGGYREIDGVEYYFDTKTFASITTIYRRSNGSAYLFAAGGGTKTGWQTVSGKTYYFYPTTGKMAEGLASVKDKLYYFDYNKGLLKSTSVIIGGVTYKLDKNGAAKVTGNSKLAKMINAGISHLDKGYGSDGKTDDPKKFTCSQLVKAVYEVVGIEFTERSARQCSSLLKGNYDITVIENIAQAKPGDLIFFSEVGCNYGDNCDFWNEIHHVAIYIGDGKVMGSFDIKGDTDNNGPMIRELNSESSSSIIYNIVRLNDINR